MLIYALPSEGVFLSTTDAAMSLLLGGLTSQAPLTDPFFSSPCMIFQGEIPVSLGFNSLIAKVRHTSIFVEHVHLANLLKVNVSGVN